MLLHGRETEQAAMRVLLGSARGGVGASLVLLGDPGSGKFSLLSETARGATPEMTVVTTSGVWSPRRRWRSRRSSGCSGH